MSINTWWSVYVFDRFNGSWKYRLSYRKKWQDGRSKLEKHINGQEKAKGKLLNTYFENFETTSKENKILTNSPSSS